MKVKAIDHVVFDVRDVEASAERYEKALGMQRHVSSLDVGSTRRSVIFGDNKINLWPTCALQEAWFKARTPAAGSDDLCFLTDTSPSKSSATSLTSAFWSEQGRLSKREHGADLVGLVHDPAEP
jgi:catechol 2,3-dioxygenase-like lactoylglutathione lyase family enzyme